MRGYLPEQYLVVYPSFEVNHKELFDLPECYRLGRYRLTQAHLKRVRVMQALQEKQADVAELAVRLKDVEIGLKETRKA